MTTTPDRAKLYKMASALGAIDGRDYVPVGDVLGCVNPNGQIATALIEGRLNLTKTPFGNLLAFEEIISAASSGRNE
ncbi:MAG: hypothetical protein ACHQPI_02915 [Thermoanaerobaculia bacterium]